MTTGKLITKAKVRDEHRMLARACARRLGGWDHSLEVEFVAQMWAEYEAAILKDDLFSEGPPVAVEQFLLSL